MTSFKLGDIIVSASDQANRRIKSDRRYRIAAVSKLSYWIVLDIKRRDGCYQWLLLDKKSTHKQFKQLTKGKRK